MERFLTERFLKTFLLVIGLIFSSAAGYAQKSVTGTVTDEQGQSLPGVNVVEKGTTNGTITDMDGVYHLSVSGDNATLVFSYMGFDNVEINAANGSKFDVIMREDTKAIDEVVVVGYGTMKKSDVSGSSISVGAEDIEGFVGAGIDQALQGKAAGVQVTANSGQPGGGMNVQIRGASTLNAANAQPLYVVDGVPIQNVVKGGNDYGLSLGNGAVGTFSGISNLNPDDIESMEILKDASATAIYGSRAANGVVLITTKQGKKGKAQFNYTGSTGWQTVAKKLDLMNLQEYAKYRNEFYSETQNTENSGEFGDYRLLGEGTDWQDAIFRTAFMHSHNLSASGGTDAVRYYISGGYYNQEGTIIGTSFDRFNFRTNVDAQVTSFMKVGTNFSFATSHDQLVMNNSEDGIISIATYMTPDIPVYDFDGNYANLSGEGRSFQNPVAKAEIVDNKLARRNLDVTLYADINFLKELTFHTEFALSNGNTNSYYFLPTYNFSPSDFNNQSTCQDGKYDNRFWQVKNFLTYTKQFGEHSLTAMVGQETSEYSWENMSVKNTGLSSNDIKNPALGAGDPTITYGFGSGSRVSFFGRAFYGFRGKYNLTYTYRRDGSSNFGPENRWGNFHSVSASWKFSEEEFFESLRGIINSGRLRLGWGQVGNDNIPAFTWGSAGQMETYGGGYFLGAGYRPTIIPNPYVTWETQESWNIGLDLNFLKDRFQFIFEYYTKTSKDMLMSQQLPTYMGSEGNEATKIKAPMGNFGEMKNSGFEITLNTNNINKKGFTWTTNFQFSLNKNELVNLSGSGNDAIRGYAQWGGQGDPICISRNGEALYQFYGYKTDGIYQDMDDLLNSPRREGVAVSRTQGVWVGDVKYKDINGDGVINTDDMTIIGDPNPTFTGGITNTLTYKGFEFSLFITGSFGNDVYNYTSIKLTSMRDAWNNQLKSVDDRARLTVIDESIVYPRTVQVPGKEKDANGNDIMVDLVCNSWQDDPYNMKVTGGDGETPRAAMGDPNGNAAPTSGTGGYHSDRYVEDGSYLKIKQVTLGYNIPQKYTKYAKINSAKVYASISNLYTFTKYTGLDPEVGVSQTTNYVSGVDIGRYPSPRIFTIGLNLQF
ncbi:MAG: TonB-dependent receptor [Bacteroidales bacterium]|nr:TonB-dependent receptor [Bacteroidales bacterium]